MYIYIYNIAYVQFELALYTNIQINRQCINKYNY